MITMDKKKYRKGLKKQVVEVYQSGMTNPHELAEIHNIPYQYVLNILNESNIRLGHPKRHYKHCERTNLIIDELKANCLSYKDIAEKYGVTRQYISEIKRRFVNETALENKQMIEENSNYMLFSQRQKLAKEYEQWVNTPLKDGSKIKDCALSVITFMQGKGFRKIPKGCVVMKKERYNELTERPLKAMGELVISKMKNNKE